MRLLSWIVMVPIAIVIVAFSVSNRAPAVLDFWPLPWSMETPIYMVVVASLIVGFAAGTLVFWLSTAPMRRRARLNDRMARTAERELAILREKSEKAKAAETPGNDGAAATTLPVPISSNAA